jgi:hypothetical protein
MNAEANLSLEEICARLNALAEEAKALTDVVSEPSLEDGDNVDLGLK